MSEDAIVVRRAGSRDLAACREIRHRVFVVEQRVPEEIEFDGLDDECVQLVALHADRPIGTARLRGVGEDAKAERVAVLAGARERGAGRALMRGLEDAALGLGVARMVLNAQVPVIAFYERLGYRAEGETFDEAGIPHRRMTKRLSPPSRATEPGVGGGRSRPPPP